MVGHQGGYSPQSKGISFFLHLHEMRKEIKRAVAAHGCRYCPYSSRKSSGHSPGPTVTQMLLGSLNGKPKGRLRRQNQPGNSNAKQNCVFDQAKVNERERKEKGKTYSRSIFSLPFDFFFPSKTRFCSKNRYAAGYTSLSAPPIFIPRLFLRNVLKLSCRAKPSAREKEALVKGLGCPEAVSSAGLRFSGLWLDAPRSMLILCRMVEQVS